MLLRYAAHTALQSVRRNWMLRYTYLVRLTDAESSRWAGIRQVPVRAVSVFCYTVP